MDRREIIQELDAEIERLTSARRLLSGYKVTATAPAPVSSGRERKRGRRRMSAEGRARIAAAQRARWAKLKGTKKK
jgi:hypothetical protein